MYVDVGNKAAFTIGEGAPMHAIESLADAVVEKWKELRPKHVTAVKTFNPQDPTNRGVIVVVADHYNLNALAGGMAPAPGACSYCGLENNWPSGTHYLCLPTIRRNGYAFRSQLVHIIDRLLFSYEMQRTARWN